MAAAGCSSSGGGPRHLAAAPSASQLAPPLTTCSTSHTAAGVPVIVEIEKGSASCQLAMHIQNGYTGLVTAGRVPGNGGGAPVQVDGWTCQGTDTTTTVQTGEASECHKGTTEIVAVLKLQSTSGSGG
jgi:UDP-N-acetylenolpyruvoylglucosamine reductase